MVTAPWEEPPGEAAPAKRSSSWEQVRTLLTCQSRALLPATHVPGLEEVWALVHRACPRPLPLPGSLHLSGSPVSLPVPSTSEQIVVRLCSGFIESLALGSSLWVGDLTESLREAARPGLVIPYGVRRAGSHCPRRHGAALSHSLSLRQVSLPTRLLPL